MRKFKMYLTAFVILGVAILVCTSSTFCSGGEEAFVGNQFRNQYSKNVQYESLRVKALCEAMGLVVDSDGNCSANAEGNIKVQHYVKCIRNGKVYKTIEVTCGGGGGNE